MPLRGVPRFNMGIVDQPFLGIGPNANAFQAETLAWITAVGVAGGTISAATKTAVNNFVISAKAKGYFSKILRCNLLCGDFAASKVPLVKTVGAATDTFNNFVSGDYVETGATGGLTGDGASKWIDPGAVANAGSLTTASCHLAYYATLASAAGVDCPMGRDVSGTDAFSIFAFTGPLQAQGLIGNTAGTAKLGTGKGFHIANSLASLGNYFNGGRRRFTPDVAVGGTIPSTSMAVFSHNAGANWWGGRMNAYSWGTGMTYAEAGLFTDDMEAFQTALGRQFTPPGTSISCWGDSLTFGYTATNSFPDVLLTSYGNREVFNGGVPGETGAQIYTRMLADPRNCTGVVVIYAGYNDIGVLTRAQIVAQTVAMVNALGTTKFVILSIPNGETAAQYNTGGLYSDILGTYTDLVALYPSNTLDMRAHLVSLHDATAQDLIDFGHDIVPVSLRNDAIHLNNAGNSAVGARLKTFIDGKGW